jgi:hypothetical protein
MPPALPKGALFQFVHLDTGRVHQIDLDGTYRVGAAGALTVRAPLSRLEGGSQTVSKRGRARLLEVAREARFFELPSVLPRTMAEGIMLPGSAATARPTAMAFSLRDGAQVHTVVVQGHLRYAPSFGPLAPLFTAVDEEAIGGWLGE